jgi:glutamyl-tRNA synthetase
LFCWLYARHHGGQFVLRIEDTDKERSTQENVDAILDGMDWLGLDADEGPIYQSERFDRYREVIDQWLDSGDAYHCYCTKDELEELRAGQMARGEKTRYDGRCRQRTEPRAGVDPVVRFKNPSDGEVVVHDQVRGRVVFQNEELDDLVMARSDGVPTYNFTVIVDDSDMNITHVIRGDDHLNNTPRQMNMLKVLGVKALLNYLVRLGWSYGDQEIFSIEEMIELFDIAAVNQSASAFNPEKLLWLNQQHIITTPPEQLGEALLPYLAAAGIDVADGPDPAFLAAGFHERAETLVQMVANSRYCYQDFDEFDLKAAKKNLRPVILGPLQDIRERFAALSEWTAQALHEAVDACAGAHEINMGKLGQPLRVAVTGGSVSPPIDVTLELVGRKKSLARIDLAIAFIEARAAAG